MNPRNSNAVAAIECEYGKYLFLVIKLGYYIWGQSWLLLTYTTAIWGANAAAARFAAHEIPPMFLVFMRWFLVSIILGLIVRKQLWRDAGKLVIHWKMLIALGFSGFSAFSALFYLAAYKTSAVNITILQSSMPPLVLLGVVIFYKERITLSQIMGMTMAIIGILFIASSGQISQLASFSFNIGDLAILSAFIFYAAYTLALRNRPAVPTLVFFLGVSVAALITSMPLFLAEVLMGYFYWPTLTGWMVLVFIALGPSLSGQLAYMRGIELVGPGRAGLFTSLTPCFGALFAVLLLNEPFAYYHAIAMILGIGGICLAERKSL